MAMEVGSQWYNRISSEIYQYQITLAPKNSKKYKLDQLLRIAKRVDDFSLGAVADNSGIGIGIGIALGVAIGAYLDRRAREEGKVI